MGFCRLLPRVPDRSCSQAMLRTRLLTPEISEHPLSPCGPEDARSSQITYKKRRGVWAPSSESFEWGFLCSPGTPRGDWPSATWEQVSGTRSRQRRREGSREEGKESALRQTRTPERRTPSSAGAPQPLGFLGLFGERRPASHPRPSAVK